MVIWAEPAKIDLKAIHDFISSDSKYYAKKVVQDIIDRTNIIQTYPLIGRKVPEIGDETFSLPMFTNIKKNNFKRCRTRSGNASYNMSNT